MDVMLIKFEVMDWIEVTQDIFLLWAFMEAATFLQVP
jgi:hypothetical protein